MEGIPLNSLAALTGHNGEEWGSQELSEVLQGLRSRCFKSQLHVNKSLFIDTGSPFSLAMIKACKQNFSYIVFSKWNLSLAFCLLEP